MKKRGLSRVVTTVIIILLVLIAIGIIWVVMRDIISSGVEGIFLGRFTIDLKIKNAYVDESDIVVNLIKRKPGQGNLAGIKFIFSNGTNSEGIEEDTTMKKLEEKSFAFNLSELDAQTVETVSIAPIFGLASGEERLGNIIDTYHIKKIEGEGNGNGEECIPECSGKTPHCLVDTCVECITDDHCEEGYNCVGGDCVGALQESIVFVSSTEYTGNLGGISGADAKCNALASATSGNPVNLSGKTFVAWLSDTSTNAKDRIPQNSSFNRIDGVVVANDLNDLIDGNIQNKINVDEIGGGDISKYVWTGTNSTGYATVNNCNNWQSDSDSDKGWVGRTDKTNLEWTHRNQKNCNDKKRLYCFQVS